MLKQTFCALTRWVIVANSCLLWCQLKLWFAKIFIQDTFVHHFEPILQIDNDLNTINKLWHKIFASNIPNHKLFEFAKLVEIVVVQVPGFFKNEWTFNIVNFTKNKLTNQLNNQFDLSIRFYSKWFFTMQNFAYEQSIGWMQGMVTHF